MRPSPPTSLLDNPLPQFAASDELADWARDTFITEGGELENADHAHLRFATIGFLWTNVPNGRHGRSVVGQAERGEPNVIGRWARARAVQQIESWFGHLPTFIITLDANYADQAGDAEFCSLVEHELYHCGQERGLYGEPKFRKDGSPAFAMRGHDVEEFVGIVRRYGVGAAAGETLALVEAARETPQVAASRIAGACGTCLALRHA